MAKKQITLTIGTQEFGFEVSTQTYNQYVNEFKVDDKISPSVRFARRTLVDKKQLDALNELFDQGVAVDIAGALLEEFRPKLEIEVKK